MRGGNHLPVVEPEFLAWLSEHGQADVRASLEQDQRSTVALEALMQDGQVDVSEKLDGISTQLATLASGFRGLDDLGCAFTDRALSDQAIGILESMEENQPALLLVSKAMNRPTILMLRPGPSVELSDARFLEDDLDTLVELGLLLLDYNSSGEPIYRYTRAVSRFVERSR